MQTFEFQSQSTVATGTHNLDHLLTQHTQSLLLPDGRFERFKGLSERECLNALGSPTCEREDDYSGYGSEWYYKAPSGNTIAIGFRWGEPRLRGNGLTTVQDVVGFVDFLSTEINGSDGSEE